MVSKLRSRHFYNLLKWLLIGIFLIDLVGCVAILTMNYLLVGYAWEQKARYDPYATFLNVVSPLPTLPPSFLSDTEPQQVIWMFGGSTLRRSPDSTTTIPSLLSRIMNSENRECAFSITNFGVDSFNSLMETKYLQKELIEREPKPDVILFFDGANDTIFFLLHRDPNAHYGYGKVKALIESSQRCLLPFLRPYYIAVQSSFTKELYDRVASAASAIDSDAPELNLLCDKTVRRYEYVNKMAQAYGARFLLLWQPMRWVERCEAPQRVSGETSSAIGLLMNKTRLSFLRKNIVTVYEALEAKLTSKPYFLSLRGCLCDRKAPAYDPDGVHFNSSGRERIAQRISDVLKKRMLLGGKARE